MEYLMIIKQKGGGCDYTIGCGIDYEVIEAENDFEIFNHVTSVLSKEDIEECYICEMSSVKKLDLNDFDKYWDEIEIMHRIAKKYGFEVEKDY